MDSKFKKGDVFKMRLNEKLCVFFQYMADDSTEYNIPVVKVFNDIRPIDYNISIDEIAAGEVAFYIHTNLRHGVDFEAWEKIGKSALSGLDELEKVWFAEAEKFSPAEIAANPDISAFDANYKVWHVNGPKTCIGKPDAEMAATLEIGKGFDCRELYVRCVYGYHRESLPFYNNVLRKPVPWADSFVKFCDRMASKTYYFHFHGEKAVRELVIESSGRMSGLTESRPEDGQYTLYDKPFGSINWRQDEFMTRDRFEDLWRRYEEQSSEDNKGGGFLRVLRKKLCGEV